MKDTFRSLALAAQLGLTVVASILVCLFLGLWIDGRLHTRPYATLILLIVGMLAGLIITYRLAFSIIEEATSRGEMKEREPVVKKEVFRSLALTTQLGLMVVGPVLIGLFIGLWLDARLYTRPWATILLGALGVLAGSVGAYRLGSSITKQSEDSE